MNLGISLTRDYEPQFQHRAHYVSSSHAAQWEALDVWWDDNRWAVCQLLEPDVEVLFGEWVWARHRIAYTRLPTYFVAYDIYNKRHRRFVSVRERNRRLDGLGIPLAPFLAEQAFQSRSEIERLVEGHSAYGDCPFEGVCLRIDEMPEKDGGRWLDARGKVIRPDFVKVMKESGDRSPDELQRNSLAD